jgi:hypothetical protein
MAAKKGSAKKGSAKLGGAKGKDVEFVLTEAYLNEHPDLAAQGFTVGQKIVLPESEAPKSALKAAKADEDEEVERDPEDEASMKADVMMHTLPNGKKAAVWYVKSLGDGKFRLYNEVGQAVSPIVTDPLQINKAASRANALNAAKLR